MNVWVVQAVGLSKEGDVVSYIKNNESSMGVFDSLEKARRCVIDRMVKAHMNPEFCVTALDLLTSKGKRPLAVYVTEDGDYSTYHYVITEKEIL